MNERLTASAVRALWAEVQAREPMHLSEEFWEDFTAGLRELCDSDADPTAAAFHRYLAWYIREARACGHPITAATIAAAAKCFAGGAR